MRQQIQTDSKEMFRCPSERDAAGAQDMLTLSHLSIWKTYSRMSLWFPIISTKATHKRILSPITKVGHKIFIPQVPTECPGEMNVLIYEEPKQTNLVLLY